MLSGTDVLQRTLVAHNGQATIYYRNVRRYFGRTNYEEKSRPQICGLLKPKVAGGVSSRSLPTLLLSAQVMGAAANPLAAFVTFLAETLRFLSQPLGGYPVKVVTGVPGWQVRIVHGPRRWLFLRPGKLFAVPDPGPWWTPSGNLHLLQNVPLGIWLAVMGWIGFQALKAVKNHYLARQQRGKQLKLLSAGKASDLLLQRNRMLKAMEGVWDPAEDIADVEICEVESPSQSHYWQDPSEWDTATRRQWENFMQKSKALKIQKSRWWDIASAEHTSHNRAAVDRLKKAGQLPEYEQYVPNDDS